MIYEQSPSTRWSLATRIAFRFAVVYFSLYVLVTQMLDQLILLPVGRLPATGDLMSGLVSWTGWHVFHATAKQVPTGSGDTMFQWVQTFCVMVIAIIGATIWSILDRRRERYERAYRWFRVFLRFALGSTMIGYGFSKVIPLQMPAPPLTRLLEPYGNFSPMGVLWYSIGASFPYERFVGLAEVAGGVLLFAPRTAMLGALICLADTVEIFMLNMTYDVPVKLFSFHLLLMSAFLVAPGIVSLLRPVFGNGARHRWAAIAQFVFGAYLVGMVFHQSLGQWTSFGGGVPRPPLYGVWVIDEMKIDGHTRAPLVTDYARWRRVVIQTAAAVTFWRMDDTTLTYLAKMDMDKKTITLSKSGDKMWTAQLTFDRLAPDGLIVDGAIEGHTLHMATHLVDRESFLLVNRGFHWVQEFPFNR